MLLIVLSRKLTSKNSSVYYLTECQNKEITGKKNRERNYCSSVTR